MLLASTFTPLPTAAVTLDTTLLSELAPLPASAPPATVLICVLKVAVWSAPTFNAPVPGDAPTGTQYDGSRKFSAARLRVATAPLTACHLLESAKFSVARVTVDG